MRAGNRGFDLSLTNRARPPLALDRDATQPERHSRRAGSQETGYKRFPTRVRTAAGWRSRPIRGGPRRCPPRNENPIVIRKNPS